MRHRPGDLHAVLEPVFAAQRERVREPWFPPVEWASPLAEEIAVVLASVHPRGLSLAQLARRLHRREGAIRAELRRDARFEQSGENRGRRWRLAPEKPRDAVRAGCGRVPSANPSPNPAAAPAVGEAV